MIALAHILLLEEGRWRLLHTDGKWGKEKPRMEHICVYGNQVWSRFSWTQTVLKLKRCPVCDEPVPEGMMALIGLMKM